MSYLQSRKDIERSTVFSLDHLETYMLGLGWGVQIDSVRKGSLTLLLNTLM